MKLTNIYLIVARMLLSLPSIAQHSYPIKEINADSSWRRLESVFSNKNDFYSKEVAYLKYREEGLKFWKQYPIDVRKYDWLFNTVARYGGYTNYLKISEADSLKYYDSSSCKGCPPEREYSWQLNQNALQEWGRDYPSLKREIIAYWKKNPELSSNKFREGESGYEILLLRGELCAFLSLSLNKEYRANHKMDMNKLLSLFKAFEEHFKLENFNKPSRKQKDVFGLMSWGFIGRYHEYGLNSDDMLIFFSAVQKSQIPIFRNWATQQISLFKLKETPFSFKHKSIVGDTIDIGKMRGKVILVDFWSLSCSSCIERMPAVKAVYDKYKSQGFEVISVCIENEDKVFRVKQIEERIGSDWATVLAGYGTGTLGQEIWNKYGFWGVPQMLLLNKEGKLVVLNDKLRNGDFEPDVRRLLAE